MDEAFLAILEKKDFAYITVKEICEKAGVNRSTFYLHYETVADLLNESVEYMFSGFLEHMKAYAVGKEVVRQLQDCPQEELYLITPKYLRPYLRYIKEHKTLFRTAIENAVLLKSEDTYEKMFRHVFIPILDRYHVPEQDRHYIMEFYIHGLMAIITEWLKKDCVDSEDDVIAVICRCVTPYKEDKKEL